MVMRSRARARITTIVLASAPLALVACSALLGIDDRSLDPQLDGGNDVTTGGDAAPDKSSGQEGGDDAAPEAAGDAPQDQDACGDTQTDPLNCGKCNHDCLGGPCSAGVCQPVAVVNASTGVRPWNIAIDGANIYFTDTVNWEVDKVDKQSLVRTPIYQGGFGEFGIAVDDASVYWTEPSPAIAKCAITGCSNIPTYLVAPDANIGTPRLLAIDDSYIYWGEDYSKQVNRIPKGGGPTLTLWESDATTPNGLDTDGVFVYFAADDGIVRKVPINGGAAENLSGGVSPAPATRVKIDSTNVYWSNNASQGTINAVSKGGAGPHTLSSGQPWPSGITADANNIYWVNNGLGSSFANGTVMMCPITNCTTPVQLASSQHAPKAIAVDSKAVYWTNFGNGNNDGSVMRVALP
jgi:hypothetical protein